MIPTPLSKGGETAGGSGHKAGDGEVAATGGSSSGHKGGRMGGAHTWFAYRHWYSTKNIGMEVRSGGGAPGQARQAMGAVVGVLPGRQMRGQAGDTDTPRTPSNALLTPAFLALAGP